MARIRQESHPSHPRPMFNHQLLLLESDGFDHHVLGRDPLVAADPSGWHFRDLVYDVHAVDHLAEDTVAESIPSVFLIKERVVRMVDKELSGGTVRRGGSSHCNGATLVFQTVV